MKIKIRCFNGLNTYNNSFRILVLNNNDLIYDLKTKNEVCVELEKGCCYKIIGIANTIITRTILCTEKLNEIPLIFCNNRKIILLLTDANYPEFKINKGEINLWTNLTL